MALFVERARSQGVGLAADKETSDLIVSTCRRLDGMPLAIELAAARLRSLSLRDLHRLLDQRFRLLTGGSRSALERQQTLRATVDWSYSLLNDPERSLLRRLSVFSDGFDLDAAGAVCAFGEIQEFDVTGLLGSLVDKSLVVAEPSGGGSRYRLLETIRQFAAERFVEAGPDEVAVRGGCPLRAFPGGGRNGRTRAAPAPPRRGRSHGSRPTIPTCGAPSSTRLAIPTRPNKPCASPSRSSTTGGRLLDGKKLSG